MASAELTVVPTLEENEAVIERGERTFIEVGQALLSIRDERQYVDAGYETFADYVAQRWGMSWRYAYDHIAASRICAIAQKHGLPAPPTEAATRPLVRRMNEVGSVNTKTGQLRDPEAGERAVVEAWREVVQRHDGTRAITGRDVAKVVSPPGSSGTPNWAEALGRVGDDLIRAGKAMDRFDALLGGKKPSPKVRGSAERYAGWADDLASRLHELARRGL